VISILKGKRMKKEEECQRTSSQQAVARLKRIAADLKVTSFTLISIAGEMERSEEKKKEKKE